ncbi:DUF397 domain-containing protein [Streptomyces sp. DG2A-72]|uniref:DUF397 domain-containing protein n=1 Tax=Streptomyces sp. DG2A-72 TaxID=3051386 RepID=UPI00265BDAAD|nr:DUF397 domain-containing protein [Streptomyces sp. DG2A-72]MDO0933614.1 DUF397 domain-containing protein [Streptomyces sp. DG2A-72]
MFEPLAWQKSSFSGGGSGGDDCVELADSPTAIHLRESEAPSDVLTTNRHALHALLARLKNGNDLPG